MIDYTSYETITSKNLPPDVVGGEGGAAGAGAGAGAGVGAGAGAGLSG